MTICVPGGAVGTGDDDNDKRVYRMFPRPQYLSNFVRDLVSQNNPHYQHRPPECKMQKCNTEIDWNFFLFSATIL